VRVLRWIMVESSVIQSTRLKAARLPPLARERLFRLLCASCSPRGRLTASRPSLFVHPCGAAKVPTGKFTVTTSVVFDLGGRGDKSFQRRRHHERQAWRKSWACASTVEPGADRSRPPHAAGGMDLVIGVSFIFTDDLTQLARECQTPGSPAWTTPSRRTRTAGSSSHPTSPPQGPY
jgi:hypothetical protein